MKAGEYISVDVTINGVPEDTTILSWEVLDRKENKSWDITVCDYGNCYVGVPEKEDMNPATAKDDIFMKFTAKAMGVPDLCWYQIRVFEKDDEANADTLVFLLNGESLSSTRADQLPLRAYPNPASTQLWVSNPAIASGTLAVYNAQGAIGE